ncbi:hydrolase [Planctomonas sp. JC2975]|uniref:hydrolase n=1 Tax=Planctomonas sp. JC2975 TaxID=2729626 RepID=UPI00147606DA|nr:hydrolase [Planctomonas sp. JC2975]NNC12851.1 hydrolase [Planctomonas sp. JC2975]
MEAQDLDRRLRPVGGWPAWATVAPYRYEAHPQASELGGLESGANCQRYAYAVLALFGLHVPPHRSSELWEDQSLEHPDRVDAEDLDLVLFNNSDAAWGAHVAIVMGDDLLHLCAEEGRPATWSWTDFARRPRYRHVVGLVRAAR